MIALLVLYSSVEPQSRQAVSPATEKVRAGQVEQTALFVTLQADTEMEPAAQVAQFAQGVKPVALYVLPATQDVRLQVSVVAAGMLGRAKVVEVAVKG